MKKSVSFMKKSVSLSWVVIALGLLAGRSAAQTVITPASATDNGGTLSNRSPSKSIDSSGLSGVGDILTQTHDGSRNNQWGASYQSGGNILTYVLPEASAIDGVHIWNACEGRYTSRGVQSFDIYFSTDNGSSYPDSVSVSGFTQESGAPSSVQTRYFDARSGVTHVQLRNLINFGNSYIYLPEIRFDEALASGTPVFSSLTASGITTADAQLSAELEDADADVTVYWEPGVVVDPESYTGWDGTNGPAAEVIGPVARTASNLTADTTYSYAFHGTNGTFGTQSWSVPETFVTPLSDAQAPVFTSAEAGISSIALAWEKNATHATSYILRRSTDGPGEPYTYIDAGDAASYTDLSVAPDTTYYYALTATNSNDGSSTSYSEAVTNATTDELVGDVIAEYLFDGSFASTDAHEATTASAVSAVGHTASIASGYYEAESHQIDAYLSGGDYLTFTITTDSAEISITALQWNYGTASPHEFKAGFFSDAYEGFDATGDVIPDSYFEAHESNGYNIGTNRRTIDLSGYPGFQGLSGGAVEFRAYMGDGASKGNRFHHFDNIRVYAVDTTPFRGTVIMCR